MLILCIILAKKLSSIIPGVGSSDPGLEKLESINTFPPTLWWEWKFLQHCDRERCWYFYHFKITYSNSNNYMGKGKRKRDWGRLWSQNIFILPWLKPWALLQNPVHIVSCPWWLFTLLGFSQKSDIISWLRNQRIMLLIIGKMMQGTCL